MHNDIWSQLAITFEMTFVIWLPTKNGKTQNFSLSQSSRRNGQSAIDQATQHIIKTKITHLLQTPTLDLTLFYKMFWSDVWGMSQFSMLPSWHRWSLPQTSCMYPQSHEILYMAKIGVSTEYNIPATPMAWGRTGSGWCSIKIYCALKYTDHLYHMKVAPQLMQDPMALIIIQKSLKSLLTTLCFMPKLWLQNNLLKLTQQAQKQLRWWDQLIQAIRGALNPQKFAAYCISGNWMPMASLSCNNWTSPNINILLSQDPYSKLSRSNRYKTGQDT